MQDTEEGARRRASLRLLLADSNADKRVAGLTSIKALGPAAAWALPELYRLMADTDLKVRRAAIGAVGALGAAGAPVLPNLLIST